MRAINNCYLTGTYETITLQQMKTKDQHMNNIHRPAHVDEESVSERQPSIQLHQK